MKIYNVEVIHKSKIEGAGRRSKEKLKKCACRLERERRGNEREKIQFLSAGEAGGRALQ